MPELRVHAGRHCAIQSYYALPDDAWRMELSEAEAAPAAWAELPNAETHLPGAAFVVAMIPDEDPNLERWFMEQVARCRDAFGRPDSP